jgi:pilus assembly protein CpaB
VSRRRRAVVLLGLALVLGGLAASDVSRREAALERRLGPAVPAVVARRDLEPGTRLAPAQLAVRRVPARFAPAGAFPSPAELVGQRTAVALGAGEYVSPGDVSQGGAGPPLHAGERVADVIAVGSPDAIVAGGRVDVLVTREGRDGGPGRTDLALEDVEVLSASPAEEGTGGDNASGAPRVSASLRVTVKQAVYLAAAQSFAREVRLLPRGEDDRERGAGGVSVGQDLRGGG